MSSARRTARPRTFDPDRRRRIATAAFAVVAERGVGGLTHRAVAAAAQVPLGSTTYHFSSAEELLGAAVDVAIGESNELLDAWIRRLPPRPDLPEELATLVQDVFRDEGRLHGTAVRLELYVAAIRRPALREASIQWARTYRDAISLFTNDRTARLLSLTLDGLLVEALVAGTAPPHADCLALFQQAAGS